MGVMNEDRLALYDGLIKTHITNTTVAKETGKGLSTNDYTTTEKNKLAGIADGANKTIVDSALNTSSTNPVQNKVIAGEINTLKKSVSDGKTLVATAITDKGVETAADATFAVMANNISQIETGGGELHGATISVTTNEENPTTITVTLTKDSTTIGQKNFDSNGLCTFTDIQESGDYTITASDGTDSNSTTATVTGDNIVNKTVVSVTIDFTLDGSTATPLNDVSIWLRTDSTGSSLNAGHTTLAEVIADTTTLNNLMADQSAMQYLARSTGFADEGCASETFMTYLGASPYVDSTVLNSDLWKQAIKASQYWELVYTTVYTIHAGALETVTIDGVYGSFTTNTDGTVNHALPLGELTLTGSVSGQSFTRTVTTDTADVYVMPEGALYWYGNECTWITGGWTTYPRGWSWCRSQPDYVQLKSPTLTKAANYMNPTITSSNSYGAIGMVAPKNIPDISKWSKFVVTGNGYFKQTVTQAETYGLYYGNMAEDNYFLSIETYSGKNFLTSDSNSTTIIRSFSSAEIAISKDFESNFFGLLCYIGRNMTAYGDVKISSIILE